MRRGFRGGRLWVAALLLAACAGKQSAVKGKLVDAKGAPVAGAKIVAAQVQPIKGYEQAEAVTGADGAFRLEGMFPTSKYVLKPRSDKWTTEAAMEVETAPEGETSVLREALVIRKAYSPKNGSLVIDLATGATRFAVSPEGVIADGLTGLEWVVGPDRDTNYGQAWQWVSSLSVAGGDWRMPTRQELAAVYQVGVGDRNMDPAFRTTGWWVWAEPRDASSAWNFNFIDGGEDWRAHGYSSSARACAVRVRPR